MPNPCLTIVLTLLLSGPSTRGATKHQPYEQASETAYEHWRLQEAKYTLQKYSSPFLSPKGPPNAQLICVVIGAGFAHAKAVTIA